MSRKRILITVKTYPFPSMKHHEVMCTAGVTEAGDFIRLHPIDFRDLAEDKKYKKYQWIEIDVKKNTRDPRKESYRPAPDSIKLIGEPISSENNWSKRARYVLKNVAQSIESLEDQRGKDRTSLGIFKPRKVGDLICLKETPEWDPQLEKDIGQMDRQIDLFEDHRKRPLIKKMPFKFQYKFKCDDSRCKSHQLMICDWEVGALFWNMVHRGISCKKAAEMVREKFLDDLCGSDKDFYFYTGTFFQHQHRWAVLGVFYPKHRG